MVNAKIKSIDFPDDLTKKLLHMILSHHGAVSLGWGSTKPQNSRSCGLALC